MSKELNVIVDKGDNVIGAKPRNEVGPDDIYRISVLWVVNSKGDVLLAQRSLDKKKYPGAWGPAAAGTIEQGESYEANIKKEAKEELGIEGTQCTPILKRLNYTPKYKYYENIFITVLDWDASEFKIQKEEVEQVKWFTTDELLRLVKEKPEMFVHLMGERVKELYPNGKLVDFEELGE